MINIAFNKHDQTATNRQMRVCADFVFLEVHIDATSMPFTAGGSGKPSKVGPRLLSQRDSSKRHIRQGYHCPS
jgi:hypothetical protein